MPFIFLIAGVLAIISALRGTEHELATQIASDFSGNPSFAYWIIALLIIGSIGYVPELEDVSTLFTVLCILSFTLSEGGVFDKFTTAIDKL